MVGELSGKRVAIVANDGFEQSKLIEARDALRPGYRPGRPRRSTGL